MTITLAFADVPKIYSINSMERPVAANLFSLATDRPDGGTRSWRRVHASQARIPEAWLQENIFANPELVLAACRAADLIEDEPWHPWCRELTVPGIGSVDVAFVSASGRVALVETKLASNPGNRREVVAQLLEYAVHLRETDVDQLPPLLSSHGEGDTLPNAEDVAHHLADGDFLLLVVGDDLDPRAVRLADNLLGRHLVHPWHLAFVDMALYERDRQLARRHPFTPIAGNDAHANIRVFGPLGGTIGSYEEIFLTLSTHVLARELTEAGLVEAFRAGRTYVSFDIFGEGTGFDFRIADGAGGVHLGGSSLPAADDLLLAVRTPKTGRIRVLRDGVPIHDTSGDTCSLLAPPPGVYRIEVETPNGDPWLFSSSIRVLEATPAWH